MLPGVLFPSSEFPNKCNCQKWLLSRINHNQENKSNPPSLNKLHLNIYVNLQYSQQNCALSRNRLPNSASAHVKFY